MRLFCALVVPDALRDEIAATANELRRARGGAFVRPASYHVTLAFIGEVDPVCANRAAGALARACRDAEPFELQPASLGSFGPRSNATLWVGFRDESAAAKLARALRSELALADVPFDEKPFRAHVTIARHVNLERKGAIPGPGLAAPFRIETAALYESELDPQGARYRIVEEVQL